uniref:SPRY-associated domain-containing protein n=1 Tax=Anabas testudineus TaxID=64144 RepID=A0A3Q1HPG2_ANATE
MSIAGSGWGAEQQEWDQVKEREKQTRPASGRNCDNYSLTQMLLCYTSLFFRLSGCNLSKRSCEALSSVLSSQSSSLRELDLSNNDLEDSGVKILSAGLENPHCKLETLRLSDCLITEEGCASLIPALSSNHPYLRVLDLSYNHPGDLGVKLLSAGLEDPHWRLDTLRYGEACCSQRQSLMEEEVGILLINY